MYVPSGLTEQEYWDRDIALREQELALREKDLAGPFGQLDWIKVAQVMALGIGLLFTGARIARFLDRRL